MLAQVVRQALLLIVCACAATHAENDVPDEVKDFCFISGAAMYNYNKKVYIYGGWSVWQGFPNYTGPNNQLRTIDVSKSFRVGADVETYVKRTPLPDTMPRDTYSTMWPIAKDTLASFFGFHEVSHNGFDRKDPAITTVQPLDAKLTLDTTKNSWTIGRVKSTINFQLLDAGKDKAGALLKIGSKMSTWVPSLRRGYYLGGVTYKDAPDIVWDAPRGFTNHRGMIVYDADSDSLSNQTMPYPQGSDGQLLHLTTKDDEILINFGGNSQPYGASVQTRSMRQFFIYSTKQSKWFSYTSPETSAVPNPHANFCATIVSAPDNSSHQIIIYAGGTPPDMATVDSVWVLSIPSFDWVKLPGNATDSTRLAGRRWDPTCLKVGKKYMMSWGGRHFVDGKTDAICDIGGNNVFLLDMSTGMWVDMFNPDDDYEVPQSVVNVVGGTTKGGATKLQPDGGFGDPDLAKLMTFNIGPGAGQTSDESGSGSSNSDKSSTANKSSTGAIVGGVVGGIAGLAIIGAIVFFLLRKKRNNIVATDIELNRAGYQQASVEASPYAVKHSEVSPDQEPKPREYYQVPPPAELHPENVRPGELQGEGIVNELPGDHPVMR